MASFPAAHRRLLTPRVTGQRPTRAMAARGWSSATHLPRALMGGQYEGQHTLTAKRWPASRYRNRACHQAARQNPFRRL